MMFRCWPHTPHSTKSVPDSKLKKCPEIGYKQRLKLSLSERVQRCQRRGSQSRPRQGYTRNPKPLKPKDSNGPLWGRLRHLVLDSHIVIAENCFGFNPRGPDKFMFEPDCHFTYVGVYVKNANVFNDAVALFSQHSNIRRVR